MFLPVAVAVLVLTVPLAGGRLSRLAGLRFRRSRLILAALAAQVVILTLVAGPVGDDPAHRIAHVATYVVAVAFLAFNRSIPGLRLVVLGTVLNLVAITANAGIMPASPSAVARAGLDQPQEFRNSQPVHHPRLLPLGDVFAIPDGWPLANVFSIGDVVLVLGTAVTLHVTCGSRLARRPGSSSSGDPAGWLSDATIG